MAKMKAKTKPNNSNTITLSNGTVIDISIETWTIPSLSKNIVVDFRKFECLSSNMLDSFKKTLKWYLENRSTSSVDNLFQRSLWLFNNIKLSRSPITNISANDILNYNALIVEKNRQDLLSGLASFIKKWHSLGYPGIDDDTIKTFDQLKLKGNEKGKAVRTMDPHTGPFSDLEFEAICCATNRAYADGILRLDEYLLIWLNVAIGSRPVQYAALKLVDYQATDEADSGIQHTIKMPRAKQHNQNIRTEFKTRSLMPQIGELVSEQIEAIRRSHAEKTNNSDNLPLFPTEDNTNKIPGFEFHRTSNAITSMLQKALKKLSVVSERTGELIEINSRRFRYTLGTRAAMEGAGELTIAELLDHTDTQNVGVYVEARPEIIERIDRAIALQMAPLAQAFCGMLVKSESETARGDDPTSRVRGPHILSSQEPVGNCGRHGFCGFAAPISCYTCVSFCPWVDGPHEEVLAFLLKEREELQASGADLRIASVNDRTIMAVAEVVRRCNEYKPTQED